jgi:hypothetical protein
MKYYTKPIFGYELKQLVLQKQDVAKIGTWALSAYFNCSSEVDAELLKVMLYLGHMEDGSEFAISHKMLDTIANDLIAAKSVDLHSTKYKED